jgi:hypothetical protein
MDRLRRLVGIGRGDQSPLYKKITLDENELAYLMPHVASAAFDQQGGTVQLVVSARAWPDLSRLTCFPGAASVTCKLKYLSACSCLAAAVGARHALLLMLHRC